MRLPSTLTAAHPGRALLALAVAAAVFGGVLALARDGAEALTQNFAIAQGDTVSNGVPQPGAGNIENPGDKDVYTFSAAAGDEVYFDQLAGPCGLRWKLTSPSATQIFDSPMCSEPGLRTLAQAGTYTIEVGSTGNDTGTYSFKLHDAPPAQHFSINIGDTISDGVPQPGAGNIEQVGSKDVYTFTAAAGTRIYFEALSGACNGTRWKLTDANQASIIDSPVCSEPGFRTLTLGGTYTLAVAATDTSTGTYSFKMHLVPAPQNFLIALGDTISNGVPSPGAGNIEQVGASDVYTFTADAGQEVYFENVSGACNGIRWKVTDANQAQVFDSPVCSEIGLRTMTLGGTYTLTVSPSDTSTGTYSFKLWDVPAPQNFTIASTSTVSNGVPQPGAGNIEEVGAKDVYTFTAVAGEEVYFDSISAVCSMRWKVIASNQAQVFDSPLCVDAGLKTLTLGGTYTLTVYASDLTTGTYSFALDGAPLPQNFNISLGDTVSDGVPSAGAGNIEETGAKDIYTFSSPAGNIVYFESLAGTCALRWRVQDANEAQIFDSPICSTPGFRTLALGGNYTLTVYATDTTTGTYSFRTYDAPPAQNFSIAIGDTVSNGVPSSGAGNLEQVGSWDIYTFTAAAGQEVNFISNAGDCALRWEVFDSNNDQLFEVPVCTDGGLRTLDTGGEYRINVFSDTTATGTYSFTLLSDAATATPTPQPTDTPAPTSTNTPVSTATSTATSTSTPTATSTSTPVPTSTSTPTPTNTPLATATNTPVPTSTSTPTPTNTPLATATNTPVPTSTNTPTPTNTPSPTSTSTPAPTDTPVPGASHTPTPTDTSTPVPTSTNTPSPTSTPSPTDTPVPTATNTPTPTSTPLTATDTPVPTATNTPPPAATDTPVATATNTPSPTATSAATSPTPPVTRTVQATRTAAVTKTVAATTTALPTRTPQAPRECLTFGQKVSLLVGIFFRYGAQEGEQRYKSKYDVNDDAIIDWRDAEQVYETPLCRPHRWHPHWPHR